jgi:hypothetical protein
VDVRGADGAVTLDGSAVKMWSEQVVPGCTAFELSLIGAPPSATGFRAVSAIFPASVILWPAETGQPATLPALAPPVAAPSPAATDRRSVENPVPPSGTASSDANGMTLHPSRLDEVTIGDTAAPAQPDEAELRDVERDDVDPDDVEPDDVDEYDYDALYGRTVARTVQGAAVRPADDSSMPSMPLPSSPAPAGGWNAPEPAPPPVGGSQRPAPAGLISGVPLDQPGAAEAPAPAPSLGDHDGLTMTAEQLRTLRGAAAGGTAQPHVADALMPAMGGPTVQALMCVASGHPNPPHANACGRCGAALSTSQQTIARPSMGRIQFSTGVDVELTRPVIIGRNPKLEGRLHEEMPHTVRIDVGREISRSHAMIRLEGWQVLVEDLGSANGTSVVLPGRPPQRLHPGEPVLLDDGARIDIGGEVWATYDARG